MSFLKLEQVFAVVVQTYEDVGEPFDHNDKNYLTYAMNSPLFTIIMYLDAYCDSSLSGKLNEKNIRNLSESELAYEVINDAIKHRWKKHLGGLKQYCGSKFLDYCQNAFSSKNNVARTLADCLGIMAVFEAIYSFEGNDDVLDYEFETESIENSQFQFNEALKNDASIEDIVNTVSEDLEYIQPLIEAGIKNYTKMCQNEKIRKLLSGSRANAKHYNNTIKEPLHYTAKTVATPSKELPSSRYVKGFAKICAGILCMVIGGVITNSAWKYIFFTGGLYGIAKGVWTLFVATSSSVYNKIPKRKYQKGEREIFIACLVATVIVIVWFIILCVINKNLDGYFNYG